MYRSRNKTNRISSDKINKNTIKKNNGNLLR